MPRTPDTLVVARLNGRDHHFEFGPSRLFGDDNTAHIDGPFISLKVKMTRRGETFTLRQSVEEVTAIKVKSTTYGTYVDGLLDWLNPHVRNYNPKSDFADDRPVALTPQQAKTLERKAGILFEALRDRDLTRPSGLNRLESARAACEWVAPGREGHVLWGADPKIVDGEVVRELIVVGSHNGKRPVKDAALEIRNPLSNDLQVRVDLADPLRASVVANIRAFNHPDDIDAQRAAINEALTQAFGGVAPRIDADLFGGKELPNRGSLALNGKEVQEIVYGDHQLAGHLVHGDLAFV